jgi:hypothetical protein
MKKVTAPQVATPGEAAMKELPETVQEALARHGQLDGATLDPESEPDFVEQAQLVTEGQIELSDGEAVSLGEAALELGKKGQPPE